MKSEYFTKHSVCESFYTENILSACISLLENGPMPLKEKKEENGRREDSLSLVLLTNCGNADN
jgi:hypothetical protein